MGIAAKFDFSDTALERVAKAAKAQGLTKEAFADEKTGIHSLEPTFSAERLDKIWNAV